MKFVIQTLKRGDLIEAEVTEILSDQEMIMSFQGDLLKVQNQIGQNLKIGQKLFCRVLSTDPLSFEVARSLRRSRQMMDRTV